MFVRLVKRMVSARTIDEYVDILYRENGVEQMHRKGMLTWNEREILFALAYLLETRTKEWKEDEAV